MDANHFDAVLRSLAVGSTRRLVLRGLAGALIVREATRRPSVTHAKKGKKRKQKPLLLNQFGCVNVGNPCRGNDEVCCSGICEGQKPKPGKRDTRVCVAHNTGGCSFGQDSCFVPIPCAGVPDSMCFRTTGEGGICAPGAAGMCADCKKDQDCVAAGFGPGAACVICAAACPTSQNNTACIAAGA